MPPSPSSYSVSLVSSLPTALEVCNDSDSDTDKSGVRYSELREGYRTARTRSFRASSSASCTDSKLSAAR